MTITTEITVDDQD